MHRIRNTVLELMYIKNCTRFIVLKVKYHKQCDRNTDNYTTQTVLDSHCTKSTGL